MRAASPAQAEPKAIDRCDDVRCQQRLVTFIRQSDRMTKELNRTQFLILTDGPFPIVLLNQ